LVTATQAQLNRVQVDDLPGIRIHLWHDAVSLSPHDIPLQFQKQHATVKRISIPFRNYDCVARNLTPIDFSVAAIRTACRYQGFHRSSS